MDCDRDAFILPYNRRLLSLQNTKEFWNRVKEVASKKDIFFNASAITFNLFICAIPFVLILISIIGYVLSYDEAFNEIVRYGEELFPQFTFESNPNDVISGTDTIESILQPLIGARQVFGIVGLIILLFFTQGLFHSVKHVIFNIFDIEDRKHPLMEVIYNFFGFGILGAVFLFFSLSISMVSLVNFTEISIPFTDIVITLSCVYELINIILPIIFTFLLQYVIFRYISERKVPRKVAIMGALTYTFLFEIAKFIVSFYLGYAFTAYQYFYQGYAVLVVIGIWTFYSAMLFVVTVIIAKAYKDVYCKPDTPVEGNPYTALS